MSDQPSLTDVVTILMQMGGQITRLDERLTETRVAVMGRIDRLADLVTSSREDVALCYTTSTEAQRIAGQTNLGVVAVRQQIHLMEAQIQRLQGWVDALENRA